MAPSIRRSGFTLVELLVVVAIIALLLAILSPALGNARAAAMATKCLAHTRTIALVMQMYANEDPRHFYPTARMPMTATGLPTWIDLTRPYVEALRVYRCPSDQSTNWDAQMMARITSYGINAYFTPNHPPYKGITPSQIHSPSETIIAAELIENVAMDHFMPMYWGDPPAVVNMMMQNSQWDRATGRPTKIVHTRHIGESNYVFTDGHAATHAFEETWAQQPGQRPALDCYDPR